jgi:L-lactate dehydrogenase
MKIGIIGMGWVGTSVAISTLHSGIANELLLHDVRTNIAEGEALDLSHGAPFYPAAHVRAATVADMIDADAVVVAAGRGGTPSQTRLDLLRDNAQTMREVGQALRRLRGVLAVVTNPVDIMTRIAVEASGLPPERVIGTGTMLDTARMRAVVAGRLHVDSHAVHSLVIGEHGDSEVVLWSTASVGGRALRHWAGWTPEVEAACAEQVRRAAYEIIARKGATNHAIGLVTADLLRALLRDERRVLTVSRVQGSTLGVGDVAISLPAIVGAHGAGPVITPVMTDGELAAFNRSAEILDNAARTLHA